MNFVKASILLVFLLASLQASAQNSSSNKTSKIDSLWHVWQNTQLHDTDRLQALGQFVWDGYLFSNPDSAYYFSQLQYRYAKKIESKRYMADALNNQGAALNVLGDFHKAIDKYIQFIQVLSTIPDVKGQVSAFNNLGTAYTNLGQYAKALDYCYKGTKLARSIGDTMGLAPLIANTGSIYFDLGEYKDALKLYEECLVLSRNKNNKYYISASLANIGVIHKKLGNKTASKKFTEEALLAYEETSNLNGMALTLSNIGSNFYDEGNYVEALNNYNRSMELAIKIGHKSLIAQNNINLGIIANKEEQHHKSVHLCLKGLELSSELSALKSQQEACNCLTSAYKALGDIKNAFVYLEKMQQFSDSINRNEVAKKIQLMHFADLKRADSLTQVQQKRELTEAHKQTVAKKNKIRNILLIMGLFIILIAVGLYNRYRFVKKSRDVISEERDRSDGLLLNILPEEIANELKKQGKSEAREFHKVSVLFTDFKEFTQTAEKLSPTELVSEIHTCFEAFDKICEKYNVEKIKTIGDAYMAAGGLPLPSENSVLNTVLASIEMSDFVTQRKAERDKHGKPAFEMRLGIHTGPVVAGIVGIKKFQYDIWGDTVNTAARMESAGEVGKINISEATYLLLQTETQLNKGAIETTKLLFETRGLIAAKGKGEMPMWFVQKK